MNILRLFNAYQKERLVVGRANPKPVELPSFTSGNIVPIEFQLLAGLGAPFEVVDPSLYSLRIGIFKSDGTQLAYQNTFVASGADSTYRGTLSTSDAAMTNAVASLAPGASLEAYFQIQCVISGAGELTTLPDTLVLLRKGLISGASATVPVGEVAATQAWVNNLFVPRAQGGNEIKFSRDGTKQFLVWLDNDGNQHIDPLN